MPGRPSDAQAYQKNRYPSRTGPGFVFFGFSEMENRG
jgi:hypothetical protein